MDWNVETVIDAVIYVLSKDIVSSVELISKLILPNEVSTMVSEDKDKTSVDSISSVILFKNVSTLQQPSLIAK